MITWAFEIPGRLPSLNQVFAMPLRARMAHKKRWREDVANSCLVAGIPLAAGKRTVRFIRFGTRGLDDDNLRGAFKSPRDGLTQARAILDDNPEALEAFYGQVKCKRGEEKIRVEVEGP